MKTQSTKKRFWQTILVALSITTIFASCQDTFDEILGICPEVEATNPDDEATGVQLNKVIEVTFNDVMNPATITDGAFSLRVINSSGGVDSSVSGILSYNDENNTMSFLPDSPLAPNTTYTGKVEPIVKDLTGNAMQTPYIWTFTTGVTPTVTSTNPGNQATGIALNASITANFSTEMDPTSITASSFTLKNDTTAIAGVVSYQNGVATFNPSVDLLPATTYTGTISVQAKNTNGIPLANAYTWTFNTGAAPTIISTDPADKVSNVSVNKEINVLFSQNMDPTTISGSTFTLKQGNTSVAGTVVLNGTTATFTPTNALSPGLVYTGTITTGAKNGLGISIGSNFVWSFTTAATEVAVAPTVTSTDPMSNAINVAFDKEVKVVFSQEMNPATISATTFFLKQGSTVVNGTLSFSGKTLSFKPNNPLSPNLVYTGTITTGARNTSGTALGTNFVWSFTTAASEVAVAPAVTSTDPANNSMNVAYDKVVKAVFSQDMDPSTISASTFSLKQGNTTINGTVSYSGKTLSFQPNSPFSPGLVYTALITTGAKNTLGVALESNYVWKFTAAPAAGRPTVTSTDPVNNANNVALNKTVKATFSELMNPATISGTTFTLKQGTNTINGSVTYSGTTASFTPNNPLSSNLTYTATITTGAENLAGNGLAENYVWTFKTVAQQSAYFVDLKTAGRFGIFAATGISNNAGFSEIRNLDVGITPGARSSVTGFPPAIVINGAIFAADDASPAGVAAMLVQAKKDLTEAYLFAEGATSPAPATVAGDQGGKTLAPGIYKSNSTLLIQAGDLTLDAKGDPNAVWIFQISSGFTTVGGAGGSIILSGGAKAENIFWQVGSSATIGDNTKFKGNVLALTSITMNSNAQIVGRMLVINGAVVMTNTNIIQKP